MNCRARAAVLTSPRGAGPTHLDRSRSMLLARAIPSVGVLHTGVVSCREVMQPLVCGPVLSCYSRFNLPGRQWIPVPFWTVLDPEPVEMSSMKPFSTECGLLSARSYRTVPFVGHHSAKRDTNCLSKDCLKMDPPGKNKCRFNENLRCYQLRTDSAFIIKTDKLGLWFYSGDGSNVYCKICNLQ